MTRLINFTLAEARALLHFLDKAPEDIAATLTDAARWPGLWVTAHREEFRATLGLSSPFVCLHPEHELTRRGLDYAILGAAVTHSTFHRSRPFTKDGRLNTQAYTGAVRCLWNARAKIAAAFGVNPDAIQFPQV